ncbi:MAG: hypothetical protein IPJ32_13655 [Sphingobacteriaceae bacterium]|nr:hypothetical protein [Sphingobacteriaceae bacterium]
MPGNVTGTTAVINFPSTPGTYSLTLIGANTSGCTSTITNSSYIVNAAPTVSFGTSTLSGAFCNNTVNTGTFTATGTASSYTWLPGNITGTTTVINFSSTPGTYSLTLIGANTNGCASTITNNSYVVNAAPTVSIITSNSIICTGNSATLSATGANTYTWLPGNSTGSTYSVSPSSSTTYTLIGTITNGCSDSAIITQSVSTCTGINNANSNEATQVSLYPNPSAHQKNFLGGNRENPGRGGMAPKPFWGGKLPEIPGRKNPPPRPAQKISRELYLNDCSALIKARILIYKYCKFPYHHNLYIGTLSFQIMIMCLNKSKCTDALP